LYGPFQRLIGGDRDVHVLGAAEVNLTQIRETKGSHILHLWDAGVLPVRARALDAVVSNLPFGKQIGSHADNPVLYQSLFGELVRTLRPSGRAVLLTSEKELMRRLMHNYPQLQREDEILVGVLGQAARIYVLRRGQDD
jgi:23S rRNA G2445 N2-methylase RlmL